MQEAMLRKLAITESANPIVSSNREGYQNKIVSNWIVLALLEHAADFKNKLGGSLFLEWLGARPGCAGSDPVRDNVSDRIQKTPRGAFGILFGAPDRIRTGDLLRDREA